MAALVPTIRTENAGDRDAIARLVGDVFKAAFGSKAEARLVENLRRDGDLLLGLVAEVDGEVVGYVAFSRAMIDCDGVWSPVAVLAPIAVAETCQRNGIGTALTEAGLRLLVEEGETVVFVLGDPDYYRCFDFDSDKARAFSSPWSGEAGDAHMVLELRPDALAGMRGLLHYAPAFARLQAERTEG